MFEVGKSYNLVFDENQDLASGSIAILLAHVIVQMNLDNGLELGSPWIAEKGIMSSNDVLPSQAMCVVSFNKSYSESTDIDISDNIAEIIKFLFKHNYGKSFDIRRVKALCKSFKKNQSYRKYLHCSYSLLSELDETMADTYVKEMLSYGLPFYIKVKKLLSCILNLTSFNLKKILYYRDIWGEETIKSVLSYLSSDKPLPEYIIQDYKTDMASNVYKINLINLSIALGKGELNYFLAKRMMETSS